MRYNAKVVGVCEHCGLEWIARGEPSEEGTQCMVQRCYCHVDMSFDQLDSCIRDLRKSLEESNK